MGRRARNGIKLNKVKKQVNCQEKIFATLNKKKSVDIHKREIVKITDYLDLFMNQHIIKEANWPIKIFNLSGGESDQGNVNKINKNY